VTRLETFINRLEVEHAADDAILRDDIKRTKQNADAKIVVFIKLQLLYNYCFFRSIRPLPTL
jgi:hypothetical protein